jgi:hypothetical protein
MLPVSITGLDLQPHSLNPDQLRIGPRGLQLAERSLERSDMYTVQVVLGNR